MNIEQNTINTGFNVGDRLVGKDKSIHPEEYIILDIVYSFKSMDIFYIVKEKKDGQVNQKQLPITFIDDNFIPVTDTNNKVFCV